ncbi:MAG TPA: nuclear transport factor 2 family protein [Anditalea sp.]|nr:nuclear transport factor 2 family protein [Anditalea sp.]
MNTSSNYLTDYEAIIKTVQFYIDGSLQGKSEIMQSGFHNQATIVGHFGGSLVAGPIQQLYDLIDGNGPAADIEPNFTSIEILGTIAVARLDVEHWSGEVIGSDTHMSDIFTLIKTSEGWKIANKMFYVHDK